MDTKEIYVVEVLIGGAGWLASAETLPWETLALAEQEAARLAKEFGFEYRVRRYIPSRYQ